MVLNARAMFCWLLYFVGITFHSKNKLTAHLIFATEIDNFPTPNKYTMRSHVVTIAQEMMEKKRIKKKIGVGYVVKAKVGDMGDGKRYGRSMSMVKYVVRCV